MRNTLLVTSVTFSARQDELSHTIFTRRTSSIEVSTQIYLTDTNRVATA